MNIKCPNCGTEYEVDNEWYGQYTECEFCGVGFVAGALQTRDAILNECKRVRAPRKRQSEASLSRQNLVVTGSSGLPSGSLCLKAWAKYSFMRLLIVFVVPFPLLLLGGFVGGLTGCAPFMDWPRDFPERLAHIVIYAAWIFGICMIWRLAWWGYKRFVVRNLFPAHSASNMFLSWIVPILVNTALSLLMPMSLQIAVLGAYGYMVWCFTIWIVVDYLMFRFISVNLLCGKEIDTRWICPAILFCIFIVVMYGFASIVRQ